MIPFQGLEKDGVFRLDFNNDNENFH
jgi:hypothetical protein